jgi:two-component system sensor histidine kinase YesM
LVAHLNDVPVLENSINSLSVLLRGTIMSKDELVSIDTEIENLRHYFSIQTLRYAGNFSAEYDIDESLADVNVPRLVLQPLAENAILHGSGDSMSHITITVRCRRLENGNICLSVEDNGRGFAPEDAPKTKSGRFSGIGLKNVQERLELYYGKDYGLTVESRVGQGTSCVITLPPNKEKEEAENV